MRLRTKKELKHRIAERWLSQYRNDDGVWSNEKHEQIYQQLANLPSGAPGRVINEIIGNASWLQNLCDECDADVDVLVGLGDPETYVCRDCLNEAACLIHDERSKYN